jgi:thioredoxin-like negative regulator of GroEL
LSSTTDSVAFGLVDVDDNGDAAMEFNTTSVPTFVFSDGTTTVERLTGADPNQLQKLLKDLADR